MYPAPIYVAPSLHSHPGLEVMGPAYRTGAGMMLCTFFAVALMILSILSYFFNSWFHLALITSLPFTILFGYWSVIYQWCTTSPPNFWDGSSVQTIKSPLYVRWFVPESPRWLLSTGRIDEAEVVVQKIAKWNKKDIPANFVHQLVMIIRASGLLGKHSPTSGKSNSDQLQWQPAQPSQSQQGGGWEIHHGKGSPRDR